MLAVLRSSSGSAAWWDRQEMDVAEPCWSSVRRESARQHCWSHGLGCLGRAGSPGRRLRGRVDHAVRGPAASDDPSPRTRVLAARAAPAGAQGCSGRRRRPTPGPLPGRSGVPGTDGRRRGDRTRRVHGRRRASPRLRVAGSAGVRGPTSGSGVGGIGLRGQGRAEHAGGNGWDPHASTPRPSTRTMRSGC